MSMQQKNRVFVVGVGMTKFEKPGAREGWDYPDMAKEAITDALADASIPYETVEQACVGYVYGDSTCGQRAVYSVGLTGIPVYNVNNNCATGSTALYMAKQFVAGGLNDCVLALGFEKMEKGSLKNKYEDRTNPMDKHMMVMIEQRGLAKAPFAPQMFGNAGVEHMEKFGTKPEIFAKIAEKNHRHSAQNPRSQFRDVYTLDQVMKSPKVFGPLTKLQCCPTSDGAAAAIICSERFVYKYGLQKQAVEIIGMSMATDLPSTFEEQSMRKMVGYDMSRKAAADALAQARLTPNDVQVIELHDCFSANELITYEALGLCPEGKAGELVEKGDNTYGGKWVVNPSGGLISKGHPLGATGLAQCAELVWQLRGQAGPRQVKNAKVALQHNLGLGGAAVVSVYRLADFGPVSNFSGPKVESVGKAPKPVSASAASASTSTASSAPAPAAGGLKAEAVFAQLKGRINEELVKKVGVVYRFDVSGASGSKTWVLDLKNGGGKLSEGEGPADATIIIKDDDFVALMTGKLNPQNAFMQGKLKVKGNMMLAQKLSLLMQSEKPAAASTSAAPAKASAPAPAAPAASGLKSEAVFAELKKRLSAEMVKKVGVVYRFDITGASGSKSWVLDLKNGDGKLTEGEGTADATIIIKDDDFVALMSGKLNPQNAFMQGKLKVKGNMMLAQKLSLLMAQKANL